MLRYNEPDTPFLGHFNNSVLLNPISTVFVFSDVPHVIQLYIMPMSWTHAYSTTRVTNVQLVYQISPAH